ncbi:hypothetical protein M3Y98_00318900 [Aphelenchoides besseyi]|nr:hypothetical protein M3Y98_00318900 [Aphelenchoides besseyi]KAI6201388.1 hypothetical protein M3Y96_00836500 [Aphelenchoides besseyi]
MHDHQHSPMLPFAAMNRSLSTPDLINALTAFSKRSLPECQTNLDTVFLASQRHSSVGSSAENANSISMERTNSHNSRNELTVPNGDPIHMSHVSNGSLISFDGNVQLLRGSADRLMMEQCDRRVSINSNQSESHRNFLSLQNVGRKIQETRASLKRTRLLHAFYLVSLPVYTIIGALIFQLLDGEFDDKVLAEHQSRCMSNRTEKLRDFENLCQNAGVECFQKFRLFIDDLDYCYRNWEGARDVPFHSMSDFTNAIVYAFSVYTSIGYGTVSASTTGARVATVIYAAFGIPLFFAFVKEEGNQCRWLFIRIYNALKRMNRRRCYFRKRQNGKRGSDTESLTVKAAVIEMGHRQPFYPSHSMTAAHDQGFSPSDQQRIFYASIILFIIYLLAASYVFSAMAQWDYFTSFYFTFSSVALIGFGDVYPKNSSILVLNMPFILIGVVLFSMCYFILQEKIRVRAFEASRKARMSISKYSHSLMLHTRPWSRRNSPAFDQQEANFSNNSSKKFDRLKKRRQSAPAITVQLDHR